MQFAHTVPSTTQPEHRRSRLVALFAVLGAALGLLVAGLAVHTGARASATTPGSIADNGAHDPIGRVYSATAVPGGIRFVGFAFDPDTPKTNLTVSAAIDGVAQAASATTFISRPWVTSAYPAAGPTTGYALTVPVPAGQHTVCILGHNTGLGLWSVLGCRISPLGSSLPPSWAAAHNPIGALTGLWTSYGQIHATGWTSDPDFTARRGRVVLYVDGSPATTFDTLTTPSPRPAGSGPRSGFAVDVPVGSGTHEACLWVVNAGFGSNTFLGCRALDTRGPAGTGTVTTPTVNTQVMTEALKHRGQPYVWAAAGPKSFDCSGLVLYAYGKYGHPLPHRSEDQFTIARLIPQSRAVPGDLVFFHDSEGDVYHVALYVGPGQAFAAIDPQDGVNYQTIWDPTSVTYGSLTHS